MFLKMLDTEWFLPELRRPFVKFGCLDRDEYKKLGFPDAIRLTPDFVVMDRDQTEKWMVEVEVSSELNDDLLSTVRRQVELFGKVEFLVFTATPPSTVSEVFRFLSSPRSLRLRDFRVIAGRAK